MAAPNRAPQYAWTQAGDSWISGTATDAGFEVVLTSPTKAPLNVLLGGAGTATVKSPGFDHPLPLPLILPVGSSLPVGSAGGTWRFELTLPLRQAVQGNGNGEVVTQLEVTQGPAFDQPVRFPVRIKIPSTFVFVESFAWALQLRPAGANCGFLQGTNADWATYSTDGQIVTRNHCAHFSTLALLDKGAPAPTASALLFDGKSQLRSRVLLQYSADGQTWQTDGADGTLVTWQPGQAALPVVYTSGTPGILGWLGGPSGQGPWTLALGSSTLDVSAKAARAPFLRLSLATDLGTPALRYVVSDARVLPCPGGVLYSPVPAARSVTERASDGRTYRWRADLVVGRTGPVGTTNLGWIHRLWWSRSAQARQLRGPPFDLFTSWRGLPAAFPTGQAFVRLYANEVQAGPDSPTYGLAFLEVRSRADGPVVTSAHANTDTLSLEGFLAGDAVLVSSAWSRVPGGPGSGMPCPGPNDSTTAPPVTPGPGPPPGPPITPRTEELLVGGLGLLAAIWFSRSLF